MRRIRDIQPAAVDVAERRDPSVGVAVQPGEGALDARRVENGDPAVVIRIADATGCRIG